MRRNSSISRVQMAKPMPLEENVSGFEVEWCGCSLLPVGAGHEDGEGGGGGFVVHGLLFFSLFECGLHSLSFHAKEKLDGSKQVREGRWN